MCLHFFFPFCKNEFKHLVAKTHLSFNLFSMGKILNLERAHFKNGQLQNLLDKRIVWHFLNVTQ